MTNDVHRGIGLMVFSMFAFALSDAVIKGSSQLLTSGQIVLFIGIGGTLTFALICLVKGENPVSRNFFNRAVLARNIGESIGSLGILTALTLNPISTVSAIQQATPIVVTLAAVVFLKESVGWRRWVAIFVSFLCVLLIIRPGMDAFDPNALWALLGVLGLSLRDLATRPVRNTVSTLQLSVYGYAVLIPTGLCIIAYHGDAYTPPSGSMLYIISMLVFSMLGYVTITASMRVTELSNVAPFRYSRLLFALILGVSIFGESPDWQTLLGAAGIIGSGLFLWWRESKA